MGISRNRRKGRAVVIGVTGGIAMGKSLVTAQLAFAGAKVCGADTIVHQLMSKGGAAVALVGEYFPDVIKAGAVDRKALGNIVFNDKEKLKLLEKILHPLVVAEENRFIDEQSRMGARIVALDIPLLFETGAEKRCDITMVASAPAFLQRARAMRRANMTKDKLERILRLQMPDREKRNRADCVVPTGLGRANSYKKVRILMKALYET